MIIIESTADAIKTHRVTFQRSRVDTDYWRAICTCSWHAQGSEQLVKLLATGHDLFMGESVDR